MNTSTEQLSRRFFLASVGMLAVPVVAGCGSNTDENRQRNLPDLTQPRENLHGILRMHASLAEEDVPWSYDGTIYGVVGETEPKPLFRFQGCEIYWVRALGDGTYELTGNTVSFFYDIDDGQPLEIFVNPYTGKRNAVEAAVQGGGAGFGFNYSEDGVRPTRFLDKMPGKPLQLRWRTARNTIWMHSETAYPPGLPQPRKQSQSMFAAIEDFTNQQLLNLPAIFSSTVFGPWLDWMDMEGVPGHLIWHAAGAKIESVGDLPTEFRTRMERDHPERMSAYPFADADNRSDFQ
jgi:hypothetical protein